MIGRNCRVGARCVLRGCYLGDGVVVEDGAVLTSSLLCDGVVVRTHAMVEVRTMGAVGAAALVRPLQYGWPYPGAAAAAYPAMGASCQ